MLIPGKACSWVSVGQSQVSISPRFVSSTVPLLCCCKVAVSSYTTVCVVFCGHWNMWTFV